MPDLVQTEIDELELALELIVHQNQPSQNKHEKKMDFFILKKCKGAICEKRHCSKKQSHTKVLKGIW